MRLTLSALLVATITAFAHAQRDATIPNPDPEVERQSFIVAPGFEVNLFAADPLLAKPIQMNWDPQGRLWVATSELYPQIKPGEKANDKIIILEDTNGDGKADRTTVFADGLLIPTGIEPGDGGAYVANSTELVHLSASKPGEKADRRKVLLSGFGTEDTHHILHTFRWGPDQSLYFNQSIYIHSHIETPDGVKRLNGGGIWRYKPDTHQLDVFVRGFVNSWGHAFDRWGQSLITDGAYGEGINHGIPGASYVTAVGATRILHGMNPGSPKHCGLEVMSGRHLPDDWQGDVLTNDFRGHRVCRFKLSDDGSTFASREMPELIKTNHAAFRPIDVKMGPDGAIYIADWYNPIIQHGEVDFRDPRRDHTHGRIWRVTAKGRPLVKKPELVNAKTEELLEHLKDPEDWTRQQAKRVLKERGNVKEILPLLESWIKSLDATDPGVDHHRLEADWLIASLKASSAGYTKRMGMLISDLYIPLSNSSDFHARAAAIRLHGQWDWSVSKLPLKLDDSHPRVRLEALLALADVQYQGSAAEAALKALDKPMDRTLDYALWLTVRELEPYWMPEFKAGKLTFGGDPKKIAFVLNAVGGADAVKPLVSLIESGKLTKENQQALWLLLAQIGGPAELEKVLKHCADAAKTTDDQRNALVVAVEESVRLRKVAKPGSVDSLLEMMPQGSRPAAKAAMRLVGLWKHEPLRASLAATLKPESPDDEWAAAFEAVALFGDEKANQTLRDAATKPENRPAIRRAATAALVSLDAPAAAKITVDLLPSTESSAPVDDLFAAFLRQKAGPAALAKALAGKTVPADVAKTGLRVLRTSGQQVPALVEALTKAGNLQAQAKEPTADEVKALTTAAMTTGDAVRGEAVFRRKDLQCLACHGIGGAGGQVGPDLTSIGASAQPDYLVESLRIPNKAVKEGYHALRVVTSNDKVYLGIKVRETKDELVLRTPEDKEISIPTKDIDDKQPTRSLMPDAIVDSLTKQEFSDLVKFMSELGKLGPYAPSKARVVRRWQMIEPTKDNMNFFRRTRVATAAEADNPFSWSPVYTRVSGDLPLADLPTFNVWKDSGDQSVLRCQLDVTTAGAVKLKLSSIEGLTLYHGVTPITLAAEMVIDLKQGVQTLTFLIDRAKRQADLRCELEDVPSSPARAAVVGGK